MPRPPPPPSLPALDVFGSFCVAVCLACAKSSVTPVDYVLSCMLRTNLGISESLWSRALREAAAGRRQFQRHVLSSLSDSARVRCLMRRLPESSALSEIGVAGEQWGRSVVCAAEAACRGCRAGVGVGLECRRCRHRTHFVCEWRAMGERRAQAVIPTSARFSVSGVTGYVCLLCQQGEGYRMHPRRPQLERWKEWVSALEVEQAWDCVDRAIQDGRVRRQLPGCPTTRGRLSAERSLAVGAIRTLADLASEGDRSAELLLLYAPRLFLKKGARVADQLDALMRQQRVQTAESGCDAIERWGNAVEAALYDGCAGRLAALVERGPSYVRRFTTADELRRHFPEQPRWDEEEAEWVSLRLQVDAPRVGFTARDLRQWARKHSRSSGGSLGWTGAIISQIASIDGRIVEQIATLWGRAPDAWHLPGAADIALRDADGWALPKGDDIRPISAPQVPRRIASAVCSRRAKRLVERYCSERMQFGLSGEAATLTYSLLPQLVVLNGGTVVVADRSQSFQTLRRKAVYDAVAAVVSAAMPSEQAEAAALVDGCMEFYARSPMLRVTEVSFDNPEATMRVDGVAQGCSLSPVLEAVTLAHSNPGARLLPPGTACLAAHDDLVLLAVRGADSSALHLPRCDTVGGSYNVEKSVAVGADAAQLVARGVAARAEVGGQVWGRPLGRLDTWFEGTWLPRFRRKCGHLRDLARHDAALAIWAAHKLRGPGGMAMHVLRGIPPAFWQDERCGGPRALAVLRLADTEWVCLLLDLAGSGSVDNAVIEATDALVYGALGHSSAARIARAAGAAGLAVAMPFLASTAVARGISLTDLACWLQLPIQPAAGFQVTVEWMTKAAATVRAAVDGENVARAAAASVNAQEGDDFSLWIEALSSPGPLHSAVRAAVSSPDLRSSRSLAVRLALARVLRLPLWPVVAPSATAQALSSASACPLCERPTLSLACGAQGNRAVGGGAAAGDMGGGLRDGVACEHVAACHAVAFGANNLTRHNRLVKVAAEIGSQCGIELRVHDGPVFDLRSVSAADSGKRPADWFEVGGERTAADARRYHGGRCCDLTIRTGTLATLEAAVKAKEKKYAAAMAAHPHLGLSIVGITHEGKVNDGTVETLRRWATSLTRQRNAVGDLVGRPLSDVSSAFGLGFAVVNALQMQSYAEQVKGIGTLVGAGWRTRRQHPLARVAEPEDGVARKRRRDGGVVRGVMGLLSGDHLDVDVVRGGASRVVGGVGNDAAVDVVDLATTRVNGGTMTFAGGSISFGGGSRW